MRYHQEKQSMHYWSLAGKGERGRKFVKRKDKEQDPIICCLQEIHFTFEHTQTEWEENLKKYIPCKRKPKREQG